MVTRIGGSATKATRIYFKEWRLAKGLSQAELAEHMGTTKQTISRVENGERDWGRGFLESFAEVIGCELSDPITRSPSDDQSIDALLKDATPEQRRMIFAMVQAALKS